MSRAPLRVGIVGCGLIGRKRAEALGGRTSSSAALTSPGARRNALAADFGARAAPDLDELLALEPDVVVVATSHDQLARLSAEALEAGAHVLVEKPAGLGIGADRRRLSAGGRADRRRQGRVQPSLPPGSRACGRRGSLGRPRRADAHPRPLRPRRPVGYDREWRAEPARSGGGELVDQGMHLLDLIHWLAGPAPAALGAAAHPVLGHAGRGQRGADPRRARVAHGSLGDAARQLDRVEEPVLARDLLPHGEAPGRRAGALLRTADPAHLPHETRARPAGARGVHFPDDDVSWTAEWEHFARRSRATSRLLGSLADAHYAWGASRRPMPAGPYAAMRQEAWSVMTLYS